MLSYKGTAMMMLGMMCYIYGRLDFTLSLHVKKVIYPKTSSCCTVLLKWQQTAFPSGIIVDATTVSTTGHKVTDDSNTGQSEFVQVFTNGMPVNLTKQYSDCKVKRGPR